MLEIKDLVQEVRAELAAVEKDMREKGEIALFELDKFELELNFVVRASTKDTVGAKTELVTAESEIEKGSEKVQKLTLHWNAAKPGRVVGVEPGSNVLSNAALIVSPLQKTKKE